MKSVRARALGLVTLAVGVIAARPAAATPSNQQLQIATTQEFETLNPLMMSMSASIYIALMVDRPMVIIDPNWNYVCVLCDKLPSLDNGLAKIIDDKGKKKISVEWHLKPGLRWGDGKPITAEDFRLAWEIGKSPNVSVPSKDLFEHIESMTVDPKDPLKFTAVWTEARYDFYQMALNPMPSSIEGPIWARTKGQASAYEKQTAYVTNPTNPGLYNGPYVLTEMKLGSDVVVRRNPRYAGKPANIEKIVIKLIPNTQTLEAALLAGDIDMVSELGMSFDQAVEFEKRLKRDPALRDRFKVIFRDSLSFEQMTLNLKNPALADLKVRQALAYGLDRKKLVQALFAGKQPVATEFFNPLDPYYTNDVVKYDHNVAKAGKLLDDAGWKAGPDGLRYKNGQKLEINLMTTSGQKTRELVEQFAQAEYKKLGIQVTIKNEPARVFFGETVSHSAFPAIAMFAWMSAPDSPPRPIFDSKEIPTKANGWNGQNYGGWSNKRADQILDAVFKEFDLSKRKVLMAELMKIYTEEVPSIPLYLRDDIVVIPTKLQNMKITGHQYYSSEDVESWTLGATAH